MHLSWIPDAKAALIDHFDGNERKLGDQRRLETDVVLTLNVAGSKNDSSELHNLC